VFIKILLHSPIILVIIIGIAKFIMTTIGSIQTIALSTTGFDITAKKELSKSLTR
jgi:hypothetical protein